MKFPLNILSLFLLFGPTGAQAVSLDCSQLDSSKDTIVILNLNTQNKIVGAVQKAAAERNENVVALPSSENPESVSETTLYSTLSELKKCNARMSSIIVAGHDGGGYYWGGTNQEGFSHDTLMTAFRHFGSVTKNIKSTYFWGCNSNSRGILRGMYQPNQAAIKGKVNSDCNDNDQVCKNFQSQFDRFYTGAFPIRTIWGDDLSALSNNNIIAVNYLYLLLKNESKLTQISAIEEYKMKMDRIRCLATSSIQNSSCYDPAYAENQAGYAEVSIAGTNGDCYYHRIQDEYFHRGHRGPKVEISILSEPPSVDFCTQELNTFDGHLLAPLLEAKQGCDGEDCSDNNPADMRDIPDDTDHGKVREVYEYFMGDSDCQLVKDPMVAAQFPNVTRLRNLVFYNSIRNSIVKNHGREIDALTSAINSFSIQVPPIPTLTREDLSGGCKNGGCPRRNLTRAQLLEKLRSIRTAVEENMGRLEGNAPKALKDIDFYSNAFYELLTIEPQTSLKTPNCPKGLQMESCRINTLIPPGWAEEAPARSPVFDR